MSTAEITAILRSARIKMQEGPLRWRSTLDPVTLPYVEASPEAFEARKKRIIRASLRRAARGGLGGKGGGGGEEEEEQEEQEQEGGGALLYRTSSQHFV